jgi:hypothetical protein
MEVATPLSTWLVPVIAMAIGGVLWAFGARIARHAVLAVGFAAGVPCGAVVAAWLDWSVLPGVVGAVLGAFAGLLLARLSYRLMLIGIITCAAAMIGGVIGGAMVDRGLAAATGERSVAAARARAAELAETVAREVQSEAAQESPATASVEAARRFWSTLDAPERTLVLATTLACAVGGLALGIFLAPMAEVAATSVLGSVLLSWGLAQALGASGPGAAAWSLATVVLATAGMAVQSLARPSPRPEPPAAPPAAA